MNLSPDIMIFGGVLVTLLLLFLSFSGNGHNKKVQARIKRIRERKTAALKKGGLAETTGSLRKKNEQNIPLFGRITGNFNLTLLSDRLEKAGKTLSAQKYLFLSLLLFMITTALVQLIVGKSIFISLAVAVVVAVGIPHMVLNYLIGKRMKQFLTLFPDAIDLIVRGLRSGLPVSESINMVAREVQEPVGSIFSMMSEQIKLGVTMEKALFDTARKLGITEFNFFVTSIILQRETGGNLSEILGNLSDVLRKRFMMKMKIKALSSEARASAMIIASLPFFVIGALQVMSPDYMKPLITDPGGNKAAFAAVFSMVTGITIMIRMTKFEI